MSRCDLRFVVLLAAAFQLAAGCGGSSGPPDDGNGPSDAADADEDADATAEAEVESSTDVLADLDADGTGTDDVAGDVSDTDGEAASPPADRVLFIGNSYTAVNSLEVLVGGLLAEAGWAGSTFAVAPGGYTLDRHADDADGTNGDTALRALLVTGPEAALGWDVVVLQQQSQIPGFPRDEPTWLAMLDGAARLRDLALAAGADVVLFMTWGYRQGDATNPALYPDYPTMQDRLADGYEELATRLSADGAAIFVAPVGRSFEDVYLAGPAERFAALYSADDSHPSVLGSYLAACTLFATLTGRTPIGLSYAPTGVDDAARPALQAVAARVVLDPAAPGHWAR